MFALNATTAAGYTSEINVWNTLCIPEDNGVIYNPKLTAEDWKNRIFDWKICMWRSYDWIVHNITDLKHNTS